MLKYLYTKKSKKKKNFVVWVSKNPGFSETSRPWMILIFTAHIEGTLIHLYMKKNTNRKKKKFWLRKGGVPLI